MKNIAWSGMVAMLAVGCSSSANLGGFSSSVDGQRAIQDLTADERTTLCNEVAAFETRSGALTDLGELDCRLNAFVGITSQSDAEIRSACQEEYDLCKASVQPTSGPCMFPTGNCLATVADLTLCVNDMFRWTQDALASTPMCSELTAATLEARRRNPELPLPASCMAITQKCPGAASTTSDADTSP
jgi:hypothetical protein